MLCADLGARVVGSSHAVAPFRWVLLVFQAPGTPIIARQVTPATIIKQVSQAQTTVQPAAALQRSPGVQVRPGPERGDSVSWGWDEAVGRRAALKKVVFL